MKEAGKVLLTDGSQPGRHKGAGPGLPLGLLRKAQLALLQLEDDAAAQNDGRIHRRARTCSPARSSPHARILAAFGTCDAGLRKAEAVVSWAWD